MKTVDLVGIALDWAVAKCEDFRDGYAIIRLWCGKVTKIIPGDHETGECYISYSPSTNWAQGGPIIDRELISIEQEDGQWTAVDYRGKSRHTGPTALIAAMRCYVQSKLADEVHQSPYRGP